MAMVEVGKRDEGAVKGMGEKWQGRRSGRQGVGSEQMNQGSIQLQNYTHFPPVTQNKMFAVD